MNNNTTNKPPMWFWIVSALALIWNLLGVGAYLAQAFMTEDMMSEMTVLEQEKLANLPAWFTAAFAIAVFAGALGCLVLLFRKKMAYIILIVSLIGVLIQHAYIFIKLNPADVIMPIMIVIVSVFLVWFAKTAISKNWIS